jgi:hypothetical protein
MKQKLAVLWTNADKMTSLHMVLMYTKNSKLRGWWNDIELIIWGATAKLVVEDLDVQKEVLAAKEAGVKIGACQACARNLGVYDLLVDLGFDVKSYGPVLTEYLNDETIQVLSI